MQFSKDNTGENRKKEEYWNLYELLWNLIQHYHNRWIDNFKIFLSFNAVLIPALTIFYGYVLTEEQESLRFLVFLLALLGLIIIISGYGLLKRIALDYELRFNQLLVLEKILNLGPVKPSIQGNAFFFKNEDISYENDELHEISFKQTKGILSKGIPAKTAYKISVISVSIYYLFIGFYSIIPLFVNCVNYKLICLIYKLLIVISAVVC